MPMYKIAWSLIVGALAAAGLIMTDAPVRAQSSLVIPVPCDFITGGGFVFRLDDVSGLERVNFGAHAGCKHDDFWGQLNLVDHGEFMGRSPYHVKSTAITAYLLDPSVSNRRDICGTAKTNAGETVLFHAQMEDNRATGTPDRFGIRLSNTYLATGTLDGVSGEGSIELHKPNPSTSGPIDAVECEVAAPFGGPIDDAP
jgi:hypothetical protein